jgi:tRNA-splicing endonuclease subunit Sen2
MTSQVASTLPVDSQPPRQTTRPARSPRPNYKHIHRFSLPLTVHPLPPIIPHNPLSVISVALSYLTFLISPPRHEVYSAYFDSATSSIHVTDEKAIRALWEMGFFGKGSLSRSEPTWLEREKKRRGLLGGKTSEEITGKRRVERREWKLERARKEREAIVQRLKGEAATRESITSRSTQSQPGNGKLKVSANRTIDQHVVSSDESAMAPGTIVSDPSVPDIELDTQGDSLEKRRLNGCKAVRFSPIAKEAKHADISEGLPGPKMIKQGAKDVSTKNEEHLQLSNEEAFFLVYALGVLNVFDDKRKSIIPAPSLLQLFRQHSYFFPLNTTNLEPDDPFMLSYVIYHHYRSLGWVVRSGVKFGVDYLLYNRGPVFAHAEYAVIILPSYEHPYWSALADRKKQAAQKQACTWWWLHCVNRVQAQVKKTLVLSFVEVPPPSALSCPPIPEDNIGLAIRRYKVREMIVRRWVPNRSRD